MSNLGHVNGVKISREFAPPPPFLWLPLSLCHSRARTSVIRLRRVQFPALGRSRYGLG